jgi:hypothetical protein
MLSRVVCFGALLLITLGVVAEERKAHPPNDDLSATVNFNVVSAAKLNTTIETVSYVKKSTGTKAHLLNLRAFSNHKATATVHYSLQTRASRGYDFSVVVIAGKKSVERHVTFNDSATANSAASGFVNPKIESVEVFVYDNQAGDILMNVYPQLK